MAEAPVDLTVSIDGVRLPMVLRPGGRYVIGRGAEVAVAVDDQRVSRSHAVVEVRDGEWRFADDSRSGSFVDGVRIDSVSLLVGSSVRLADPVSGPVVSFEAVEAIAPAVTEVGIKIRIGRASDNDIVVSDLAASRHHAEVRRTPEGLVLTDCGSRNGTYVDGERIASIRLTGSERITIGAATFRVDAAGERIEQVRVAAGTPALEARGLTVSVPGGRLILDDVSFSLRSGELLAVVGPTGAGKSTLMKALTGARPPEGGEVLVGEQDLYLGYEELRPQIAYVPQEDIVHPQLTVRQALRFGAELRFASEVSGEERDARIDTVLTQLGLSDRTDVAIASLSGGQRKRTSVALELLAEPRVLILDEPTSGLDPGFERAVMQLLRELADGGCAVIVVTHAVASLDLCDNVLFLAPGGRKAYFGSPTEALRHFGERDYPAVFRRLIDQAAPPGELAADARRRVTSDVHSPARPVDWTGHLGTLMRRQVAVLAADRRNLAFLAAAAVIPAVLILALVGFGAFAPPERIGETDARTLLGALIVTAAVLGAANGVREIVKEQALYQRERALGLSRVSYLMSKFFVLGAVTVAQIVVLVLLTVLPARGPGMGNLLPLPLELLVDAALTAVVALSIGLLISAFVSSSEKAMALVPVVFVVCWLFSGAAIDLRSKPVMQGISFVVPSSWGMAAGASTVDLEELGGCAPRGTKERLEQSDAITAPALPPECERRWDHGIAPWLIDIVGLVGLALIYGLVADGALARHEPLESQRRGYLAARFARRVRHPFARR